MRAVHSLEDLRSNRSGMAAPFGLVPTMGYLHEGHLSLIRRARAECPSVGVSIFVNPTQFGPNEDLNSYPRDIDRDLRLLEAEGVDLVWIPSVEQVYPPRFQTAVVVEQLPKVLEGAHRPGHFRGVTTVVCKLFNAFLPDRAYFGQKDAQQSVVLRRMVMDLNFPVRMVICPTVREPDGLAMSSRNAGLDEPHRAAASILYRALSASAAAFNNGERNAENLRGIIQEVLDSEPLARPQYVSVADAETLDELSGEISSALLSLAVYVGDVRLIDNMLVGEAKTTFPGAE